MDVTIHSLVLHPAEDDGSFIVVASIFPWPLKPAFDPPRTRRVAAANAERARALSCQLAQQAMWDALAEGDDIHHFDCPHCPTPDDAPCGKRRERPD